MHSDPLVRYDASLREKRRLVTKPFYFDCAPFSMEEPAHRLVRRSGTTSRGTVHNQGNRLLSQFVPLTRRYAKGDVSDTSPGCSRHFRNFVCWFSALHREVFSGYSGFPSPQKPAFDLICVNC